VRRCCSHVSGRGGAVNVGANWLVLAGNGWRRLCWGLPADRGNCSPRGRPRSAGASGGCRRMTPTSGRRRSRPFWPRAPCRRPGRRRPGDRRRMQPWSGRAPTPEQDAGCLGRRKGAARRFAMGLRPTLAPTCASRREAGCGMRPGVRDAARGPRGRSGRGPSSGRTCSAERRPRRPRGLWTTNEPSTALGPNRSGDTVAAQCHRQGTCAAPRRAPRGRPATQQTGRLQTRGRAPGREDTR
jgi:hypothetical protein